MTITQEVQAQLRDAETNQPINLQPRPIAPAPASGGCVSTSPVGNATNGTPWTADEHERFLFGLELFPSGPWKAIAKCVGSRSARQTMSHAQKYRQKIARRMRAVKPAGDECSAAAQQEHQQRLQHFEAYEQEQQEWLSQELIEELAPSASATATSNVKLLMAESFSVMHLSNEQIDEILLSLCEDDGEPLVFTSDDMAAIMTSQ